MKKKLVILSKEIKLNSDTKHIIYVFLSLILAASTIAKVRFNISLILSKQGIFGIDSIASQESFVSSKVISTSLVKLINPF